MHEGGCTCAMTSSPFPISSPSELAAVLLFYLCIQLPKDDEWPFPEASVFSQNRRSCAELEKSPALFSSGPGRWRAVTWPYSFGQEIFKRLPGKGCSVISCTVSLFLAIRQNGGLVRMGVRPERRLPAVQNLRECQTFGNKDKYDFNAIFKKIKIIVKQLCWTKYHFE